MADRAHGGGADPLEPQTEVAMQDQVEWELADSSVLSDRHAVLAMRWHRTAKASAAIAAFLAGVGSVSIFVEKPTLGAILAMVAAAVSAFVAAYDPARVGERHQISANEYEALLTPFSEILFSIRSYVEYVPLEETDSNGKPYDSGFYKVIPLPPDKRSELWKAFRELRMKKNEIKKAAPPITRPAALRGDRGREAT